MTSGGDRLSDFEFWFLQRQIRKMKLRVWVKRACFGLVIALLVSLACANLLRRPREAAVAESCCIVH